MTIPPKITADAWANAVTRGETMLGYDDWKKEQLQAKPEPDEEDDEPVEREYGVRIWATYRTVAETTVTATSFDEAVEKAKALAIKGPMLEFSFEIPEGYDPEGDETVHVFGPDDEDLDSDDPWEGDGVEIDRRSDGEPFSWEACAIVKDMAKLHGLPTDPECLTQIEALINRAKAACTKSA